MPVKQVVIVTCHDHWEQCKFLLESIDRYLQGYKILLVDNTPQWANLTYQLTNNHLQIVPWQQLIPNRVISNSGSNSFDHGWISQQLIKLSAHKFFTGDYVCLDSTSVILKCFENTNWPRDKWAVVPHKAHTFYKFYLAVIERFKLDITPVIPAQVPYVFNSEEVKELLSGWDSWDNFEKWFTSFTHPSEFWLYELWMQQKGVVDHTISAHYIQEPLLVLHHKNSWDYVKTKNLDTDFYTVGCIRRALWVDEEFKNLIKEKGLDFLKP